MKINRILLFFAWFFFINQPSFFTQVLSNTVSGGGVANGANGIITYSIGQVADISATGPNGIFLEGVQQPYEISIITGIELLNINLSVYPNPTQDFLTLSIKDIDLLRWTPLLDKNNISIIICFKIGGLGELITC